jgi:hypothetical protein
MSYRGRKVFLVAFITGVLVHYSVAWAVLECFHGEDENYTETVVPSDKPYLGSPLSNHPKGNIQCIGSEYRIEPLASSSISDQPSSLTRISGSLVNGLSVLYDGMDTARANLWLFALFERVSIPIFQSTSPRYLSLSVLRI